MNTKFKSIAITILACISIATLANNQTTNLDYTALSETLLNEGETGLAARIMIWNDIAQEYHDAYAIYNDKLSVCLSDKAQNKPEIAILLQSQYDDNFLQQYQKDIADILFFISYDLAEQCSISEKYSYLNAEILYFSNLGHHIDDMLTILVDINDQDIKKNVTSLLNEIGSTVGSDKVSNLSDIKQAYYDIPFSILDTYFESSNEMRSRQYQIKAEQANPELFNFLFSEVTEQFEIVYLMDELEKLYPYESE